MEPKGFGGRQQKHAETHKPIPTTHFNVALEMPTEMEEEFMIKAREFFRDLGVTFKEVGGGPSRSNGKRCPECNELIHYNAPECGHCGAKELK